MEFLLYTGVLVLAFVCALTVIIILMQRPSANAGMGAALGGGAAEQAFGGEAGNVLTRFTTILIIAFFLLSFGLFLGFKGKFGKHVAKPESGVLTDLTKAAPAATTPVAPAKTETPAPGATAPTPAPAAK